ncbi:MAG: PAS domain S-box protein [Bacteroidota bacterium]
MDELNLLHERIVALERDNLRLKETEKKLHAVNQQFQASEQRSKVEQEALLQTQRIARVGSWDWDVASDIVTWSDELFQIFRLNPEHGAVPYADHNRIYTPGSFQRLDAAVRHIMESGEPYELDLEIVRGDATNAFCTARGHAKKDAQGKIAHLYGSFQDITDRKHAEVELHRREERFRAAIDNSPYPIAVVDESDQSILYWSKNAVKLYGHDPKTMEEWYELAYPDPDYRKAVIERWKPFLETASKSGNAINTGEYNIQCKNGSVKICELHAQFIPGSLIVTLNDITERKKAEEQLQALNQQLSANEQQLKAANQQLQANEQQLLATNQQLRANEQQLHAANQQLQANEQQLRAAIQQLQASEQQLIAANEELVAGEQRLKHTNQQLFSAKQRVEESEAMLRAAMENSPAGIAIAEVPSGNLLYVNKAALSIRGKDYEEIVAGIGVEKYVESWQILHLDGTPYKTDEVPLAKAVLYGESSSKEFIVRRADGEDRYVAANASPILNDKGERISAIVVFMDITESKLVELSLKRANDELSKVQQIARVGSWYLDTATNTVTWSKELYRMYGFDPELPVPPYTEHMKLFTTESWERLSTALAKTAEQGIPYDLELSTVRSDKSNGWMWVHGEALYDASLNIIGLWGVAQDISDRKEIEVELQNAKEKAEANEMQLKAIIESSPTGFAINRISTGEVTYVNKAFADAYHIPIEMCSDVSAFFDYVYRDQMELGEKILADLRSNDPERMKWEMVPVKDKKANTIHYVSASNIVLKEIDLMVSTVLDITTRIQNEYELTAAKELAEESEEKLKRIANNIVDGMIYQVAMLDENKRKFNYVSDAVTRLYGCTPEQVMENPDLIYGRMHPDDIEELIIAEKKALEQMSVFRTECRVISPDGSIRWAYYVSQPRVINDVVCWDGIEVDITERKRIETELMIAKEKAEESDRLKSAFLANMSHEIRTPMNGILGFTDLLKEPKLSGDEKDEYIRIIESSGFRLLNTVNDIIDISKIEAGQMKVSVSDVSICELMEQLYTFFNVEAQKKGLQLILDTVASMNKIILHSDKGKIYSILTNLIKNAIKYTQNGSVEFGCSKIGKDLRFYVKDTGRGISRKRLETVFGRFIRGSADEEVFTEGSGLGLSIAKAYVEMLGGEIWVESEEGAGSRFYFTIPCDDVESSVAEHDDNSVEEKSTIKIHDLKILIAEDDEAADMLLSVLIKDISKEVLHAKNGARAVELCRNNPDIDLILMDIFMPELNGYDATRQIREFNSDVVIIAQTAYALAGDREKSLQAGCHAYISKPIMKKELMSLIQQYVLK